jgi:hypothetical protein
MQEGVVPTTGLRLLNTVIIGEPDQAAGSGPAHA